MLPVVPLELLVPSKSQISYDLLLPKATGMQLTAEQAQELTAFQATLTILGPAGGSVLVCPGNQEGLTEDKKCAYAAKCPLLRMRKAPEGSLCPIERVITEERFTAWCREFDKDPMELDEVSRITIADLVVLDLQEQRCVNILSSGEAARMTQVNVTEAINFTNNEGQQTVLPLTWERVLHINAELLDSLRDRRMIILKNWMLTPEQKWKIAKAEGKAKGTDLGSRQSVRGDKLRSLDPAFE